MAANYNRPQPPPYSTNSLHHRKTDKDKHTPETRSHLALEESLKLLNQANINKYDDICDKILDLTDGTDDYVPIKEFMTDTNYIKPDIDNVAELAKYGITGVGPI